MSTRTYKVPGMTCGHCVSAIEGELAEVDGVVTVAVDLETKLVRVEGLLDDPGVEAAVRAAIDEAGFDIAPTS